MAEAGVVSAALGNRLQSLLTAPDIEPGDAPSYQLCKIILSYHPLGRKMAFTPVAMAQSQPRKITVQAGPEDRLKEAFEVEWRRMGADRHISQLGGLARAYGITSVALICNNESPGEPLDYDTLWRTSIGFNVLDPLNTAGSLVLNQDPNALDFQKVAGISVQGQAYHRSRTVTLLNEEPLYIEYTGSAFGFVGRSVYQRPLYSLKTYIQLLITTNMVSLKVGVLVAMMKQAGSIIDNTMKFIAGIKRAFVQEARTNNVISINIDEKIESLNLQNMEPAYSAARKNNLEDIATGADMPAMILNQETLAEGFGEGTEDARRIAQYVNGIRTWLAPAYDFFDPVCMHRAWNEEFYRGVQRDFPEQYGAMTHAQAFYKWKNSYAYTWPDFLEEPESEEIKVEEVKFEAIVSYIETMAPLLDPANLAKLIQWACESISEHKLLFGSPLQLDYDTLGDYLEDKADQAKTLAEAGVAGGGGPFDQDAGTQEPKPPKPKTLGDSANRRLAAAARLEQAVARLPDLNQQRLRLAKG